MILIIDNYDSFTYNLYQSIAKNHTVMVKRNDQITLDEIKRLKPSGIILSPGPGRPENAGICLEVIKQLHQHIPILGVCLGHQAIAVAFDGLVGQADEIVHGKAASIFHNRSHLYNKLALPFKAARYHSLIVNKKYLPNCLQIEAENDKGTIMGLKHKQFPVFGVQFHPESILTTQGEQLINNFLAVCSKETTLC